MAAALDCGAWASPCGGFSCCRAQAVGTLASVAVVHGLGHCSSWALVAHRLSCFSACGIFPDKGLNLCTLHWQADSKPLDHQGSPDYMVFILLFVDVYHTDWFANIEKSLLPWDKSHVIMVGLSCLLASSNRKESAHNAGDWGLIPGSGRSPGKGNDYPLRYSCLENLVDREEPGGLQSMGLWRDGQYWVTRERWFF